MQYRLVPHSVSLVAEARASWPSMPTWRYCQGEIESDCVYSPLLSACALGHKVGLIARVLTVYPRMAAINLC